MDLQEFVPSLLICHSERGDESGIGSQRFIAALRMTNKKVFCYFGNKFLKSRDSSPRSE
jgi:hypothetical protein